MSSEFPERLLSFPLLATADQTQSSVSGGAAHRSAATDEDLLALVREGSVEGVTVLFDRYSRLVYAIARRTLRDLGEAEDLVQEFFLQLRAKARTFDPAKGSARTWMIQVAYRQAVGRRSYLIRRSFYAGKELSHADDALQEEFDIEDHVASRLTGSQLMSLMDKLNAKQQTTLRLHFFEGCDLREIAIRLGETYENVRHYYYRGLERLRKDAANLGMRID